MTLGRAELVPPQVRAERCVHSLIEQASCHACVAACPKGAWLIDDERLGIDTSRCDGCDLCVPACPQAAIIQRYRPLILHTDQGAIAFTACEFAGIQGEGLPIIPCLHALGLRDLLGLVQEGVGQMVTASGDCDHCWRGRGEGFPQRLDSVNHLLEQRQLPSLIQLHLGPSAWLRQWEVANHPANRLRLNRRDFFQRALQIPIERIRQTLEGADASRVPPGQLLPPASPGEPLPFAPVLDDMLCAGCDACMRLCPHAALGLELSEGKAQHYVVRAENCTGCGICLDVCATHALSIQRWQAPPRDQIPLVENQCRSCGVRFHLPQGPPPRSGGGQPPPPLCVICFRRDHSLKLFQVLD